MRDQNLLTPAFASGGNLAWVSIKICSGGAKIFRTSSAGEAQERRHPAQHGMRDLGADLRTAPEPATWGAVIVGKFDFQDVEVERSGPRCSRFAVADHWS
jgi:hypothetical protein